MDELMSCEHNIEHVPNLYSKRSVVYQESAGDYMGPVAVIKVKCNGKNREGWR